MVDFPSLRQHEVVCLLIDIISTQYVANKRISQPAYAAIGSWPESEKRRFSQPAADKSSRLEQRESWLPAYRDATTLRLSGTIALHVMSVTRCLLLPFIHSPSTFILALALQSAKEWSNISIQTRGLLGERPHDNS